MAILGHAGRPEPALRFTPCARRVLSPRVREKKFLTKWHAFAPERE
jgi:hypothetical protein